MNPKIRKLGEEIERTKAKIAELEALLPELERRKKDMEDAEIVKLVRGANIVPGELTAFLRALKAEDTPPPRTVTPARQEEDDAL